MEVVYACQVTFSGDKGLSLAGQDFLQGQIKGFLKLVGGGGGGGGVPDKSNCTVLHALLVLLFS